MKLKDKNFFLDGSMRLISINDIARNFNKKMILLLSLLNILQVDTVYWAYFNIV